jgi:hypothetical protein
VVIWYWNCSIRICGVESSGNFCCFWEKIEFVRVWDSCVLDEIHQVHMNLDDFDLFLVEREKEKVFVMIVQKMIGTLDFD